MLRLEEVPIPEPSEAGSLVRVKAAGINPSDIGNAAGHFKKTTLARTPGRDFAGIAVKGRMEAERSGAVLHLSVSSTMVLRGICRCPVDRPVDHLANQLILGKTESDGGERGSSRPHLCASELYEPTSRFIDQM